MRVGQRGRHLARDAQRLRNAQLRFLAQPLTQRAARHIGDRVPQAAGGLAGVEHDQDVGVGESSGEPDLAEEPLGAERVGEFRVEDLDRHLTIVLEIVGEVDGGHAALAELALEHIAIGEGLLQPRWKIWQGIPERSG